MPSDMTDEEIAVLSPNQLRVLKEFAKRDGKAQYMPYRGRFGGAYWFVSGTMKRETKAIEALLARGLLTKTVTNPYDGSGHAKINAKGRRCLAAAAAVKGEG